MKERASDIDGKAVDDLLKKRDENAKSAHVQGTLQVSKELEELEISSLPLFTDWADDSKRSNYTELLKGIEKDFIIFSKVSDLCDGFGRQPTQIYVRRNPSPSLHPSEPEFVRYWLSTRPSSR